MPAAKRISTTSALRSNQKGLSANTASDERSRHDEAFIMRKTWQKTERQCSRVISMHRVGSILQFVGGAIGRVAMSGIVIGLFFVIAGVTPWQFFVDFFQNPLAWLASPWISPSMTIIGLVLIGASFWFNLWSRKQHIIDDLAEDIAWAINNLLNRSPTLSTPQAIAAWEADFRSWCDRVSRKLENRAFFTRADQLHFDVLGFIQPIAVAGHAVGLAHLESQLNEKLKRLRDVINWTQQRRR